MRSPSRGTRSGPTSSRWSSHRRQRRSIRCSRSPSAVSSSGSGSGYRELGLGFDVAVDVDFGKAHAQHHEPRSQVKFEKQKEKEKEKEKEKKHEHERVPSESSTSLESSQLSYNFVNSPALGVSMRVDFDGGVGVVPHPHRSQHQLLPHSQNPLQNPLQPLQTPPPAYLTPYPAQPPSSSLLDAPFLALLEETHGILASPDFAAVLEACLERATKVLFEGLERNVFGRNSGGGEGPDHDYNAGEEMERIRLAGLLPGLARWSQLALEGLPNELVDKILDVREVSCLSAIVFARFEERFASC